MTIKITKKPTASHMPREIGHQPKVLQRIINDHIDIKSNKVVFDEFTKRELNKLKRVKRIIFLGCGTSYHAAMYGSYLFEELVELNCEAERADEFSHRDAVIEERTAVISLSQSGKTADTARAAYLAKKQGALVIAITNNAKSELAGLADAAINTRAGRELAVAATKTFTAQLLLLAMLAVFVGRRRKLTARAEKIIVREITRLPKMAREILTQDREIKTLAKQFRKIENLAVLGGKLHFPIALEAALKLKETAYIKAEGFAAGEFRHGPMAIIKKGYSCLYFTPTDSIYIDNINVMKEIKRAGGKITAITTTGDKMADKSAHTTLTIPKTLEMLTPILSIIPLQLLAYYIAVSKRIKVDKPRNIGKVVK